jgi:hypothetical protein
MVNINGNIILIRLKGKNNITFETYDNIPNMIAKLLYSVGVNLHGETRDGIEMLKAIRKDCTKTIAEVKRDFEVQAEKEINALTKKKRGKNQW